MAQQGPAEQQALRVIRERLADQVIPVLMAPQGPEAQQVQPEQQVLSGVREIPARMAQQDQVAPQG